MSVIGNAAISAFATIAAAVLVVAAVAAVALVIGAVIHGAFWLWDNF